jgi:hypothetical protein
MLTNQLHTIEETLDLLKRVEIMEASEGYQKPYSQPQNQNHNAPRQGSNPATNDRRGHAQNEVRLVQYFRPWHRFNGNNRRNNYNEERERESNRVESAHLNPNAPSFQRPQEPANQNETRSEN